MNTARPIKARSTRNFSFAALVFATVAWCVCAGAGMTGTDRLPRGEIGGVSGEGDLSKDSLGKGDLSKDNLSKESLGKEGATGADEF